MNKVFKFNLIAREVVSLMLIRIQMFFVIAQTASMLILPKIGKLKFILSIYVYKQTIHHMYVEL